MFCFSFSKTCSGWSLCSFQALASLANLKSASKSRVKKIKIKSKHSKNVGENAMKEELQNSHLRLKLKCSRYLKQGKILVQVPRLSRWLCSENTRSLLTVSLPQKTCSLGSY